MNSTKLFVAIVSGGVLFGAALGNMAYPEMKFSPGEDWRARHAIDYSTASMQFVDPGPEDLSPAWAGPVYDGPNYLPAVFASDQDWEHQDLMDGSYIGEDRYSPYRAEAATYDDTFAAAAPAEAQVPRAVERASEEAARIAAEMLDLPAAAEATGSTARTRSASVAPARASLQ